jgi:hypothetical protein
MEINSEVIFADEKLKKAFLKLQEGDSQEIELKKSLEKAFSQIEKNAFCGIQIPKRLIPKEYVKKYGRIDNLWKVNLPKGWRLLYTIKRDEVVVISIILEWMTHSEYEKRFGY